MERIKVLVVADWHGEIYAQAFFDAFKDQGCNAYRFSWKEYFKHCQYRNDYDVKINRFRCFYYKFQNKFIIGPAVTKINRDLLVKCNETKPDLIFIYRGTHIYPKTIKKIKQKLNCRIFGYNNDDPFSKQYPSYLWRYFLKSIPSYDHIFSYRLKNMKDYLDIGYKNVSLLRSYYLKDKNFEIENVSKSNYNCDVIFIGHFEDDGRDDAIKLLIERNIDIKLYGTEWEKSRHYNFLKEKLGSIKPIYTDYNLVLNSTNIALVFLSKLNNDTYTRRCFEIPATKTMMLAEYTDDLANNLFTEGKEAEYFRDKEELLRKVLDYLDNKDKIKEIAEAGYKRLIKDGNEVSDRIESVLKIFNKQ